MKKPKRGKVPAKKKGRQTRVTEVKAKARSRSTSRTNGSGERSQVLPGMKKFRDEVLDNHCETVQECRGSMSTARADEQSALQAALKRMGAKKIDSYKHGRVELLRSPGEEKIRARVLKNVVQQSDEGGPIIEDEAADLDNGAPDTDDADDTTSTD